MSERLNHTFRLYLRFPYFGIATPPVALWFGIASTSSVFRWSEFLAADPEVRLRFPALPDFVSNGSGTVSTQYREYS
jgi:hypothetical protein